MQKTSPLPYTDTKPVGAADFYCAINATFRFICEKFSEDGLRQYWKDLGKNYFTPVSQNWARGGLSAVAEYWKAFFAAEPKADVEVISTKESVELNVKTCPAIKHLRDNQREIIPCFCQHCYFVSETIAEPAGLTVRIDGGNGSCRQVFLKREANPPAQDFAKILEAR